MGEQNTNRRWIVLLNKAPKGPFTQLEVQELLEDGIIRRNDLACIVEESHPADKKKSEWKLLWQFEEFDRRGPLTENTATSKKNSPKTIAPTESERRQAADAEAMRQQALAELPKDWQNIAPEDLLPHSTSTTSTLPLPGAVDAAASDKHLTFEAPRFQRFRWAIGLGMVVLSLWYFGPQFWKATSLSNSISNPLSQAPVPMPKNPRPVPAAIPQRLPARAAVPAPAPVARPRTVQEPSEPEMEDGNPADMGEIEPPEEEVQALGPLKKQPAIRTRGKREAPVREEVPEEENLEADEEGEPAPEDETGEPQPEE